MGCVIIIIIIIIIITIIIIIIKIIIVMIFIRDKPVGAVSSGIKGGPVNHLRFSFKNYYFKSRYVKEVSKREKHLPACVLKAGRRCSTC